MTGFGAVFRRELLGYFITPIAYVFIVIFLVLAGVFTFSYPYAGRRSARSESMEMTMMGPLTGADARA